MLVSVSKPIWRSLLSPTLALIIGLWVTPLSWSDDGVVQVLAYKGETLLNQGSGLIIAKQRVLTSAHLLEKASIITIVDSQARRYSATVDTSINSISQSSLALLAVEFTADNTNTAPLILPKRSLKAGDTVQLLGYWHDSPERAKKSLFPIATRPRFVAEEVPALVKATGLYSEPAGALIKLVASIGRGGYGGAALNRCGELVGIVTPDPQLDLKALWKSHSPLGTYIVPADLLLTELSASGLSLATATESCLSAKEKAQQKAEARQRQLEAELAKQRRQAKAAETAKAEAQAATEREREALEHEQQKNQDLASVSLEADKQLTDLTGKVQQSETDKQQLTWLLVGIAALGILLVIRLQRKRALDRQQADSAIAAASASYADCEFSGHDAKGVPMAFKVLGRDLLQREQGLLVGRNPEQVQIVIADDTVSRIHARLSVDDNQLYIEDMGSTGGTRLNGVNVDSVKAAVMPGDTIEFGSTSFKRAAVKES